MKFYLVEAVSGIEPIRFGPYKSDRTREEMALKIHRAMEEEDVLFWANVSPIGGLEVGAYSGGFFHDEDEPERS